MLSKGSSDIQTACDFRNFKPTVFVFQLMSSLDLGSSVTAWLVIKKILFKCVIDSTVTDFIYKVIFHVDLSFREGASSASESETSEGDALNIECN